MCLIFSAHRFSSRLGTGSSYSDADAVHYLMLQRNLLYTAITRAKKLVVLVSLRKVIDIAIHNDKVLRRYTGLAWRLAN